MAVFALGLALFLGPHSVRIVADPWRTRMRARFGNQVWRTLYALVSLLGFGLFIWAYGSARWTSTNLWLPPMWTRHLAALLTIPAFVLMASAYVPRSGIKAKVGHPMLASVKLWAVSHLLANGRVIDIILFGSFLVWAVFAFRACRARDRVEGVRYEAGPISRDVISVLVGLVAWALFTFALHQHLIGVAPLGLSL